MEAWQAAFVFRVHQDLIEWDEESSMQERLMSDWGMLFTGELAEEQRRGIIPHMVKDRHRGSGHEQIWKDYFSDHPTYSDKDFKRRHRMSRCLCCRLLVDIPAHDNIFVQSQDAANRLGLSTLQKVTSALRQLAYGYGADATDEYCRIGETMARKCLYRFCRAIREVYDEQYLRKPNSQEFQQLLAENAEHGFPGMIGSLDCMHYEWSNCPVAWQGAYGNKDRDKTIVLEAVANQELYIWHAYFGLPGANNDINVLQRSPLICDLLNNGFHEHEFFLNGVAWTGPYLLVDGIYPTYHCFVQTIPEPQTEMNKHFAKLQ